MEVIFIKDLRNQGKKGQIKNVKDGYAQNFLIKNGYAVIKNKENLSKLNNELKKKEQEVLSRKKEALQQKEKLQKEILDFKVRTGSSDKVFGSISVKQIKEELAKRNYKIEKNMIKIDNPICTLGFHNVDIELYAGVIATIKVHLIK